MLLRLLCSVLVALPWLWPITAGPTATMLPYLASAAMGGLLLAFWPAREREDGAAIAAWSWLAAALLSSLIALLQYFDLELPLYPVVNIAQPGQAFGNLRQPNQLASLLMIGALALRWLLQRHRLKPSHASWMGALLLVALAATASRIGLVELIVLGAVVLWWSRRLPSNGKRALVAVAALAIFLLAALALPALIQNTEGVAGRDMLDRLRNAESTCGSRLILWNNVLHLIAQKPWLGWGWGELDYAHYITLYEGPRFCHILDNAHNLPLHLAVELGVPVAFLTCALAAWFVWRAKPWSESDPSRQMAWGVLGVIAIHSMVEYPLWYGPFQIAAALCVWLLCTPGSSPAEAARPKWRNAAAIAMMAAVAYAGWDYHRISQLFISSEERAEAYRDNTLGKTQASWLFADVVRFAEVTTRPANRESAQRLLPVSLAALHFSPEPRVITKVIESASLLEQDRLALAHMARFRAAFPVEYQEWAARNAQPLEAAQTPNE
ncbi:PglL family O-oligosaccharyltransferase [Ottowia thiooxydans]|uniref:PglL family O-oligosaccharyltransferase n=1 Tax=Ottowia thiooxydans TaxID=219182 RepID=UPI000412C52A|nr:Wzy polymerase domain-containing protein [Ottowia thiooxydans]